MKHMIPRRHHRNPKGLWKPRNVIFLAVITYRYWWDTSGG